MNYEMSEEGFNARIKSLEIEIAHLQLERDKALAEMRFTKKLNSKWAFAVEKIACGTKFNEEYRQAIHQGVKRGMTFYRNAGIEFKRCARLEQELPKHKFEMILANLSDIEQRIDWEKPKKYVLSVRH